MNNLDVAREFCNDNLRLLNYPCLDELFLEAFKTDMNLPRYVYTLLSNSGIDVLSAVSCIFPRMLTDYSQETLIIPNNVKILAGPILFGNKTVQSITIPKSVCKMASGVFSECFNLREVRLEENTPLDEFPFGSFLKCTKLNYVSVPSCFKINFLTFQSCTAVVTVAYKDKIYIQSFEKLHLNSKTKNFTGIPESRKNWVDNIKFIKK